MSDTRLEVIDCTWRRLKRKSVDDCPDEDVFVTDSSDSSQTAPKPNPPPSPVDSASPPVSVEPISVAYRVPRVSIRSRNRLYPIRGDEDADDYIYVK